MSTELHVRKAYCYEIWDGTTESLLSSAFVSDYDDGKQVYRVETKSEHRGHGHASRIMHAIIRDHGNINLFVTPDPHGDRPMSKDDLIRWYKRLGFVPHTGKLMRRSALTKPKYDLSRPGKPEAQIVSPR